MSRQEQGGQDPGNPQLGPYLEAVGRFLALEGYGPLCSALSERLGRPVAPAAIETIEIRQEKHGAFYHPARATIHVAHRQVSFAVNGALSAAGRSLLAHEFSLLQRLGAAFTEGFLPRVFFQGDVPAAADRIPFFLAEWFCGYHEFHLSAPLAGRVLSMRLWHPRQGRKPLDAAQALAIQRRAAFILTYYYDPQSFAQIFPWHHAAGDFVARLHGGRPRVRLVTARQYAPMIHMDEAGPDARHEALLFFMLNLTLRNRLDRLDGVGAVAWAGATTLAATLEGFWEALENKRAAGMPRGALAADFRRYLGTIPYSEIDDALESLLQACRPDAPEREVMAGHLGRHRRQIEEMLRR